MNIEQKTIELKERQAQLQRGIQYHAHQREKHAQAVGQFTTELLKVEGGLAALAELTAEEPTQEPAPEAPQQRAASAGA